MHVRGEPKPVGGNANRVRALWRVRKAGEHLAHPCEAVLARGRPRRFDLHAVDEVADRPADQIVELICRVRRIDARRERHDANVEPARDGEIHPAKGGRLAGGVRVEAKEEPLREMAELFQLLLRECRSHRGDDRAPATLMESEHVRV